MRKALLISPAFARFAPIAAAAVALSFATVVSAQTDPNLRVYEGFNGYTGSALAGQTPNGNTIGLDQGVAYYDGTTGTPRTAGYTLQSESLAFAGLQTSGGSLAFTSDTNVIGSDINIGGTAFTGTLWSSYLIKFTDTQGGANGNGAVIRVGNTPADSTSSYFQSWADSRALANTANVSIGYGALGSNAAPNNGTGPLASGTTYIIINRFTRVGQSLTSTNPGVATLWALTEAQFADFLSAGGDEAALVGTSVTATATSTVTSGTFHFSSSKAIGIVTVGDAGVYDEIRFGSTLASVTPIPEPATAAALAGLVSAVLCGFARRRRS